MRTAGFVQGAGASTRVASPVVSPPVFVADECASTLFADPDADVKRLLML